MGVFIKHIIVFTSILLTPAKVENMTCLIKIEGIKAGAMYASHNKINNMDYYSVATNVEMNLFVKIKITHKTISIYKDNQLIKSTVNSFINNKNYTSQIVWDGHKYKIDCHTHKYNYVDSSRTKPIYWSASKMYFEKPTDNSEVITDTYGKISFVKEVKANQFKYETNESRRLFIYNNNGFVSASETNNRNMEIIRINDKP